MYHLLANFGIGIFFFGIAIEGIREQWMMHRKGLIR